MSVDSMAGWALETGLAVSALIFVILLIRRPVAQYFGASAAYALWALPFIRLCLPEITLPALSFLPKSFLSGKNPGGALSELTPIEVLTPVSADFYPIVLDSVALTRVNPTSYVAELLIAIWLMGAAAWLVYCFMRQRHFMKTLQQNTQAPSQTFITQLAEPTSRMAKLKNLPVIRIASDETGPLVTGLLRPVVVLPTGFTERLTARQQQFALLHEFTHIRRADLWVACAWLLFRALNWPNPLVHIAARHFRSDQEAACDATVLAQIGDDPQNRHSYGETLLCSVKLTQGTRTHQYMHQPLKLALNHSLKERLMVLKSTQSVSRPVARLWATGVIAGGLALSAPYTFADGSSDELAGEAKTEKRQVIRKRKIIKGDGDVEKEERIEVKVIDGEMTIMRLDPETGEMKVVQKEDLSDLEDLGVDLDFDKMIVEKDIEIMKSFDGEDVHHWQGKDGKRKIIIRSKGEHGKHMEKHIVMKGGDHPHPPHPPLTPGMEIEVELEAAEGLLEAAEDMIERAEARGKDTEDTTRFRKAQRKLEKARKALQEAQEELARE